MLVDAISGSEHRCLNDAILFGFIKSNTDNKLNDRKEGQAGLISCMIFLALPVACVV